MTSTPRRRWVLLCAALALFGVTACQGSPAPKPAEKLQGTLLDQPLPKPTVTLTDISTGKPTEFTNQTAGKLTLLYFGYTHCPDVCPTVMADVAAAMRAVPADIREQVRVVMVTSDPARDTPAQFRTWLNRFDPSFTGMTGPMNTIVDFAQKVGIGIDPPKKTASGDYEVEHGTRVVAFTPDGEGRVLYPADTTSDTYAHDIPILAREFANK